MKRFFLFCGDSYYPRGGWKDFQGDFDTREEAEAALAKQFHEGFDHFPNGWWEIVDTVEKTIDYRYEKYPAERLTDEPSVWYTGTRL